MRFTKNKPEPFQPGNPHKLTRNQHIFPRASIERFYNSKSKLSVILISENKRIPNIDASSNLFCAARVWDQRAETGYMASIERKFQFLADRVLAGESRWLDFENNTATLFYSLWEQRAHYAKYPVPSATLQGIRGENLTKDQRERLEANFYMFAEEAATIPSRQMTGLHIQRAIDKRHLELKNVQWRVCYAGFGAGEFLVSDRPAALFIPLSPTVALVGNSDIQVADISAVRLFNLVSAARSDRFLFARDFSLCFPFLFARRRAHEANLARPKT